MLRLNLLPTDRKQAWILVQQLQQWRGAMIVVALACVLANAALFVLDRYQADAVTSSNVALTGWQALNAKRESGQVTKTTTQLNATISGLQGLFAPISPATGAVALFVASLPGGIQVTNLKVSSDGSFGLAGTASTRTSFLALRTALDDNPMIKNLATDSTASLREKVPFAYTGQLIVTP